MIEFVNVSKGYGDNVGLSDVNIKIEEGEFVFLVGPSGAGKSTFIKLLLKEIDPDDGNIYFRGKDITNMPARLIPNLRRNLGVVFQDFRLLPKKTVYENVAFAMEAVHQKRRLIKRQVPHILRLVGISEQAARYPHELSGGEAQRVAIARAIVNNPKVLIADEPTGNLDPEKSWEIMNLLEQINLRGTTVVMVTHEKDIVDRMGKRVIQIDAGEVVRDDEEGFYIKPQYMGDSDDESDWISDAEDVYDDFFEDDASESSANEDYFDDYADDYTDDDYADDHDGGYSEGASSEGSSNGSGDISVDIGNDENYPAWYEAEAESDATESEAGKFEAGVNAAGEFEAGVNAANDSESDIKGYDDISDADETVEPLEDAYAAAFDDAKAEYEAEIDRAENSDESVGESVDAGFAAAEAGDIEAEAGSAAAEADGAAAETGGAADEADDLSAEEDENNEKKVVDTAYEMTDDDKLQPAPIEKIEKMMNDAISADSAVRVGDDPDASHLGGSSAQSHVKKKRNIKKKKGGRR